MNLLKSGVKGCLILTAIGFGVIAIITIVFAVFNPEVPEEKPTIDTSGIVWDSLDIDKKRLFLDAFIESKEPYDKQNFRLGMSIYNTIKGTVKYPETLEFYAYEKWSSHDFYAVNRYNSSIIDYETGEFQIEVDYRAENDYGQKVRSKYFITTKFNGQTYEIIDVKK